MFTLLNPSNSRVYRIRRSGKSVIVRFGPVGSILREVARNFETVREAKELAVAMWNTRVQRQFVQMYARDWYSFRVQ